MGKFLLLGELVSGFSTLLSCGEISAVLINEGCAGQGVDETKWRGELLCPVDRFLNASQSLIRIAERPNRPGTEDETTHAGVVEAASAVHLRVIEGNCLFQMLAGEDKVA